MSQLLQSLTVRRNANFHTLCVGPFPCFSCLSKTANCISSTCSWQLPTSQTAGCWLSTPTTCVASVEFKRLPLCWAEQCVARLERCIVGELQCPSSGLELLFVTYVLLRATRMGRAKHLERFHPKLTLLTVLFLPACKAECSGYLYCYPPRWLRG